MKVSDVTLQRDGLAVWKTVIVVDSAGIRRSVTIRDDADKYQIQRGDDVAWDGEFMYWRRLDFTQAVPVPQYNMAQPVKKAKVMV